MKTKVLFLIVFSLFELTSCVRSQSKVSSPSDWETYRNDRLGITFRHPSSWIMYGEESQSINREGAVMSVQINFLDTMTSSALFIEYYLAPYGAELYEFSKAKLDPSQEGFAADATKIEVAGKEAIESSIEMRSDIKGNIIDPPLKIVFTNFLDKQQMGEFQLRFKTPLSDCDIEVSKFRQLLSTIEFIHKD